MKPKIPKSILKKYIQTGEIMPINAWHDMWLEGTFNLAMSTLRENQIAKIEDNKTRFLLQKNELKIRTKWFYIAKKAAEYIIKSEFFN